MPMFHWPDRAQSILPPSLTPGQAASRLSQEAKTKARARSIAKLNELREQLGMPDFVPADRWQVR